MRSIGASSSAEDDATAHNSLSLRPDEASKVEQAGQLLPYSPNVVDVVEFLEPRVQDTV